MPLSDADFSFIFISQLHVYTCLNYSQMFSLLGVPLKIILTKIDKICSKVDEDTSQVFKSKSIKEQVDNVSQLLGIPRNHVLLVKNYESEIELKTNVNILALMTLRHMLRATKDYMFNFMEEEATEATPVLASKD